MINQKSVIKYENHLQRVVNELYDEVHTVTGSEQRRLLFRGLIENMKLSQNSYACLKELQRSIDKLDYWRDFTNWKYEFRTAVYSLDRHIKG